MRNYQYTVIGRTADDGYVTAYAALRGGVEATAEHKTHDCWVIQVKAPNGAAAMEEAICEHEQLVDAGLPSGAWTGR